jgi:hypothetical protein
MNVNTVAALIQGSNMVNVDIIIVIKIGMQPHSRFKNKEPTLLGISLPHNARCGERKLARRCHPRALNLDVWMQRRVHHQVKSWKIVNEMRNEMQ